MRPLVAVLAALTVLAVPTTRADAQTLIIADNSGGNLDIYIKELEVLRASAHQIVVDRQCLSACTLITALPQERLCVTDRAKLGFHAAWVPGPDGRPVTHTYGTAILWGYYPE